MAFPTAFSSVKINSNTVEATGGTLYVNGTPVLSTTGASVKSYYLDPYNGGVRVDYEPINFELQRVYSLYYGNEGVTVNTTIDWQTQELKTHDSSNSWATLDWRNCQLRRAPNMDGQVSFNWESNSMFDAYGVLSLGEGRIGYDYNEMGAIDWGARHAHKSDGIISIDWENCALYGDFGPPLDWNNRTMGDRDFYTSVDWGNHILSKYDVPSVDWGNRKLLGYLNNKVVDYNNGLLSGDWQTNTAPTLGTHLVNKAHFDANAHSRLATTPVRSNLSSFVAPGYVLTWTLSGGSTYHWSAVPRISTSDLQYLYNWNGQQTVSASEAYAKAYGADGSFNSTINWADQQLLSIIDTIDPYTLSAGVSYHGVALDWRNYIAYAMDDFGTPVQSINWKNRVLIDGSTINSVNYHQRSLFNSAGGTVANWNSRSLFDRWFIASTYVQVSNSASSVIDWSTASDFTRTISANMTFSFVNMLTSSIQGQKVTIAVTNPSNYTVTWPAGIKWQGGVTPTQTIGTAPVPKTDIYTFWRVGTVLYGSVSQNHF